MILRKLKRTYHLRMVCRVVCRMWRKPRQGLALEKNSDASKFISNFTYPNITAFQTIILFSDGAPLTPAGGSSCNLDLSKHKTEPENDTIRRDFAKNSNRSYAIRRNETQLIIKNDVLLFLYLLKSLISRLLAGVDITISAWKHENTTRKSTQRKLSSFTIEGNNHVTSRTSGMRWPTLPLKTIQLRALKQKTKHQIPPLNTEKAESTNISCCKRSSEKWCFENVKI